MWGFFFGDCMEFTFLKILVLIACAVLGYFIYDQLVKPVFNRFKNRLAKKLKARKEKRYLKEFHKGMKWTWGVWGTGEYTFNCINSMFHNNDGTGFVDGVNQALRNIHPLERERKIQLEVEKRTD